MFKVARTKKTLPKFSYVVLLFLSLNTFATENPEKEFSDLFTKARYADVVQKSHEALLKNSRNESAKIWGARALFKLGLNQSARLYLSRVDPKLVFADLPTTENFSPVLQESLNQGVAPTYEGISRLSIPVTLPAPLKAPLLLIQARSDINLGNFREAKVRLAAIEKGSADYSEGQYLLGTLALRDKNYPEAVRYLHESGNAPRNRLALARAYYAQKNFGEAIATYDSIEKSSPYFRKAKLEAALAGQSGKRAVDNYDKVADHDSWIESLKALQLLAWHSTQMGDTEKARKQLSDLENRVNNWNTLVTQGAKSPSLKEMPGDLRESLATEVPIAQGLKTYAALESERERLDDNNFTKSGVAFSYLKRELSGQLKQTTERLQQNAQIKLDEYGKILKKSIFEARFLGADSFLSDYENKNSVKALESAYEVLSDIHRRGDIKDAKWLYELAQVQWELGSRLMKDSGKNEPQRSRAENLRFEARETAERLLRSVSSTHPYHAKALFFAAFTQFESKSFDGAKKLLKQFVAAYPTDGKVDQAYQMWGDIDFDNQRFSEARSSYQQIINLPTSKIRGYALYRLAWSEYELNHPKAALANLKEAIEWTDQWEKSDLTVQLQKEAKRDFISIYAETEDTKNAPEYFQSFLRNESPQWVEELAHRLDESGEFARSEPLYLQLIHSEADPTKRAEHRSALLRNSLQLRKWEGVQDQLDGLRAESSSILGTPQSEKSLAASIESVARDAVLTHLKEQDSPSTAAMNEKQRSLDESYLGIFREWNTAKEPLHEHGRVLAELGDLKESQSTYRDLWTRYNEKLDNKEGEEILHEFITVLHKLEVLNTGLDRGLVGPVAELLKAIETYRSYYPNGKSIREISFLESSLYFRYGAIDQGIRSSQAVFDFNPRDEYAKRAFDNLRVAYYKGKDWNKVFAWATEIWSRHTPGIDNFRKTLSTIRGESLFLWAESTENDQRAGDLFFSAAKEPDLSSIWEKSLYNAFIRYEKGKRLKDALKAAEKLELVQPNSEKLATISGSRASIYQDVGLYKEAYPYLLNFIRTQEKVASPEAIQQSRFNAALIAEATGQMRDADILIGSYLAAKPASGANLAEAEQARDRMRKSSRRFASSNSAYDRLAEEKRGFERTDFASEVTTPQIRQMAQNLDGLTKRFLSLSGDHLASAEVRTESLCSIPLLYDDFAIKLEKALMRAPMELRGQIDRLRKPLVAKGKEVGEQCIKNSMEVEHDGTMFRLVNEKWGWQWDPILSGRIEKFAQELSAFYPRSDQPKKAMDENDVIELNFQGRGDAESWYSLVLDRCHRYDGMCRLTINDAFQRFPFNGKILNVSALYSLSTGSDEPVGPMLSKAAHLGSSAAMGNLAYYHLKGGRLSAGLTYLRTAWDNGEFDWNNNLKNYVSDWVKK